MESGVTEQEGPVVDTGSAALSGLPQPGQGWKPNPSERHPSLVGSAACSPKGAALGAGLLRVIKGPQLQTQTPDLYCLHNFLPRLVQGVRGLPRGSS